MAALLPALVDAAMQLRREQLRAGAGNVARAGDAAPEIVPPEKQSMHDEPHCRPLRAQSPVLS